jgi:hypothetical protein
VQDWNPVLETGNVDVEGRMGDAKNWGLDKERQSLKERRARVESARERGAHMGRLDGCSAARMAAFSVQPPHATERESGRTGCCDLRTARDAAQREMGNAQAPANQGQLCTAKHGGSRSWGGRKVTRRRVGLILRRDFPLSQRASFHWQRKRQGEKIDEQPGTARWGAAGGLGKSYPAKDVPLWRQVGCSAA